MVNGGSNKNRSLFVVNFTFITGMQKCIFKAREVSWNKETLINMSSGTHKKTCSEKIGFFLILLIYLKWEIKLMDEHNQGTFLQFSKKGTGDLSPREAYFLSLTQDSIFFMNFFLGNVTLF